MHMAFTTQAVLFLLCQLAFCATAIKFLLPKVLDEKSSQLSEPSALRIRDEIVSGSSISKELCEEAGFLCGPLVYSSRGNSKFMRTLLEKSDHAASEEKAAALFFTVKHLSSTKFLVVPPLTDSKSLQANKFAHPALISYLKAMTVPQLLRATGFDLDSAEGLKIRENWDTCNMKALTSLMGETKECLYSPAEMVDYVFSTLLRPDNLQFTVASRKQASYEEFELIESTLLTNESFISCHTMWYPFGLFMCHTLPMTRLYEVGLKDMNGGKVTIPVVCHMDTSHFDPTHIAFKILKAGPGKTELCHWMPNAHIAWYN